ncbi:hypothetical protein LA080_011908 [Diaporthe eres]|uniref:NmrA-like domain-containing protein n=1 Tax=Diaporthe vaccinii TaxID=105482 RepID=A0ABR4DYB6_9PEZI|nr:hypothetical protein LA080_011908 [Diaporthe eres]
MSKPFVAVAGATGQLGRVIATNLRQRNVPVKAIIRRGTAPSRTEALRAAGVTVAEADLSDVAALTENMQGAACVVSALNGLRDTMHDTQGALLDAAVAARVPRFIPSDYSLDFTKTRPGSNRNLDLRREFHARLDDSGIAWTSVLNGGFMDLLGGGAPLINHGLKRVLYWGSDAQKLNFTTIADTAAYTAAVAADPSPTPRFLRIAGDTFSAKELAETVSRVRGTTYSTLWVGSTGFLEGSSGFMRRFSIGGGEQDVFPAWQGMQYMVNMFSGEGKLDPLDNARYPELKWTKAEEYLAQQQTPS